MSDLGKEEKANFGFHPIQVSIPPVLQYGRENKTSRMATSRGPASSQLPGDTWGLADVPEEDSDTYSPTAMSILVTGPAP